MASVPEVRRARKVSSLFSLILAAYVLLFFALSLLPGSGSSAGAFILLCACAGASGAEFIAAFAVISYGALLHRILRSPYCGSVLLSNADPSGLCSARRFILPLSSVLSDDSFMLSYVAGENNTKYFLTPVSEGKCPPCIGLRDGENAVGTDKVQTVFFSEDASASRYEGNHTATAGVMPADVAAVLQNALLACGRTDSVGQTVAPISAEGFGDADDRIAGQIEEYWKKAGTKGTSFRDFKGITGYASSGGARICSVYTPAGSYAEHPLQVTVVPLHFAGRKSELSMKMDDRPYPVLSSAQGCHVLPKILSDGGYDSEPGHQDPCHFLCFLI